MCKRYFVSGSPHHDNLLALNKAMEDFYEVMYAEPMFMSSDGFAKFKDATLRFGRTYQLARQFAMHENHLDFIVRPKVHKMQHLPMLATLINPRFAQNYAAESGIGTITRTWRGSANGRYRKNAQKTVLIKRIAAVLLKLEL